MDYLLLSICSINFVLLICDNKKKRLYHHSVFNRCFIWIIQTTLKCRILYHSTCGTVVQLTFTRSNTNDESGNQDKCHSILQISLRCNESLKATCSLLPMKWGSTSSISRVASDNSLCLMELLSVDFFLEERKESQELGFLLERDAVPRCADNESQTLKQHGLHCASAHHEERMLHSHMLARNWFSDIWPRATTCLSTPYTIALCVTVWSYVFLCLV